MSDKASRKSSEKAETHRKHHAKSGSKSPIAILIAVATIWIAYWWLPIPSVTGPPSAIFKRFASFDEFFPFYLTEHSNGMSRFLHFSGTTIFLVLVLVLDYRFAISLLGAAGVGLITRQLFQGLQTGIPEFASMGAAFLLLNLTFLRRTGLELIVVSYAFAWVGHFFFERNQPATFLYPVFSLAGDFRMYYAIVRGQVPLFPQ